MRINACSETKNKQYVPHQIRSHPFKCITLPTILLFMFMSYWFMICPAVFIAIYFSHPNQWPFQWILYFWITALIIFILLLILLLCIWRCKKSKNSNPDESEEKLVSKSGKKKILYTISINNKPKIDSSSQEDKIFIPLKDYVSEKTTTKTGNNILCDNDRSFPRCSLMIKNGRKPSNNTHKQVSPPESAPVSPRELFFHDLLEGSNKSTSSITRGFIENEKYEYDSDYSNTAILPNNEHPSDDVEPFSLPLEVSKDVTQSLIEYERTCCSDEHFVEKSVALDEKEYFIANIPNSPVCKTQAFLLIDENTQVEKIIIPGVPQEIYFL